ncbi:DUF1775 domain-containing protein [Streptomyces sp. NPDC051098]|uniref:DUF1775 domain-containing protein n=1 Tax=Streptomyces sp. NPDC051098 TaxID=3155411 RepID=UPI00341FAFEF
MPWTSRTRAARRIGQEPSSGAPVCAVRAGVFAGIGTALAVTGHHLVSGHPVPWRAVLLAGGLLFVLALPLVRSARSLPTALLATAAAQAALHVWFLRIVGREPGHEAHATASHDGPGAAWQTAHHDPSMTAAHVMAALLVAWCLHRADTASRLVGLLVEMLGGVVLRLVPAGILPVVSRAVPAARTRSPSQPHTSLVLAHAVVRRGPPTAFRPRRPRGAFPAPASLNPPWESPVSRTTRARIARRFSVVAGVVLAASVALAAPASAHVEVESEGAAALAQNVTLNFSAESESDKAGITKLEVILPEGILPSDIAFKKGPAGWKLTPTARGYAVSGPKAAVGADVAYSVVVRQLPDAKSVAFKTLQTYSDGEVHRWIELEKPSSDGHGHGHGSPAPVLELKAAAPGAKPVSPTPTTEPTTAAPTPATPSASATDDGKGAEETAETSDSGSSPVLPLIIGVVVIAALGGGAWWFKRRGTAGGA